MSGGASHSSPLAIFSLAALLVVGGAVALALYAGLPPLLGYIGGINLATMVLYGYDKQAAVHHRLRVPENVLHVVALLGGSPAALISQRMFRHKTAKTSFRVSFWLIVVVQVALIAAAIWWRRHPPAWLPDALR